MSRVLVVDNHDSFVHTLAGYLVQLGAETEMVEADEIADPMAAIAGYDGVLISPGPGTPRAAGASIDVVRAAAERRMPVLGVCLGHQVIAEAFGARVAHAPELVHGLTSPVHHDGSGLFVGLPNPFDATRYHSLAIVPDSLPDAFAVTARTDAGVIMAITHRDLPLVGVQFHPESVLTQGGHRMLGTWLEGIGQAGAAEAAASLTP